MPYFRQHSNETIQMWLARLQRVEASRLSRPEQFALALNLGYARYRAETAAAEARSFIPRNRILSQLAN
jgi:hypothetical protein